MLHPDARLSDDERRQLIAALEAMETGDLEERGDGDDSGHDDRGDQDEDEHGD